MAKVSSLASRKARTQKIVDKMVIKDRIQRAYAVCSREMMVLKKAKRDAGYCGGSPSCMVHTGDESLCSNCKHQKNNPIANRSLMEYGRIRRSERAAEKVAKPVKASKKKAA